LDQRHEFRSARELVGNEIVFIDNAVRLPIIHDRSDMCPEMNDCDALIVTDIQMVG
jgi:hypothetical protein